jgi:hypothetical protein
MKGESPFLSANENILKIDNCNRILMGLTTRNLLAFQQKSTSGRGIIENTSTIKFNNN